MLNINDLINNKLSSKFHTEEEIDYIVQSYLNNKFSDDKMTEWLKAVFNNNMNIEETAFYTKSIINSGEKIKFNSLNGYIIDKHSTGGIGDKVSLVLGPILAACNCYVPMIVGRHLGHTGGTLDKLESISGYNGLLSKHQFKKTVKTVGISIIGQTDEICPADEKIYSLRGKTDTVASLPLICGSIMSKKIAEGIKGLVLDIKVGNGAFIENIDEANKLGNLLALIGSKFGVNVKYINSDMNQPLGNYAGLLCEIVESIESLKGNGPKDLMKVVFELGEIALNMAGENNSKVKIKNVINDGSALEVFYKMIFAHGGDVKKINIKYKYSLEIRSEKEGKFQYTNTKKIGDAVNYLNILNGKKDINSGIKFFFNNNYYIKKGDLIIRIFGNCKDSIKHASKLIKDSYKIKIN